MTTPRTIAGQAALSAMRPHVKRALGRTIVRIEMEAVEPYLAALAEADRVLAALTSADRSPSGAPDGVELVRRARAARELARPLLAQPPTAEAT
jgi:hypothetical protein